MINLLLTDTQFWHYGPVHGCYKKSFGNEHTVLIDDCMFTGTAVFAVVAIIANDCWLSLTVVNNA